MKELSGMNIEDALGRAFTRVSLKKRSILREPLILAV